MINDGEGASFELGATARAMFQLFQKSGCSTWNDQGDLTSEIDHQYAQVCGGYTAYARCLA